MRRGKSGDRQGGEVKHCHNSLPCSKSISPFGAGLRQDVPGLPLKRADRFPRSQRMTLIALRIIRRIDYLAYGSTSLIAIYLHPKNQKNISMSDT